MILIFPKLLKYQSKASNPYLSYSQSRIFHHSRKEPATFLHGLDSSLVLLGRTQSVLYSWPLVLRYVWTQGLCRNRRTQFPQSLVVLEHPTLLEIIGNISSMLMQVTAMLWRKTFLQDLVHGSSREAMWTANTQAHLCLWTASICTNSPAPGPLPILNILF